MVTPQAEVISRKIQIQKRKNITATGTSKQGTKGARQNAKSEMHKNDRSAALKTEAIPHTDLV